MKNILAIALCCSFLLAACVVASAEEQNIIEDIIIIVSCTFPIPNKLKKANKTIYLSKMDDFGNTLIRDGKSYGFEFNITDSELQLYNNSNLNIKDRINKSFRKEVYNGKYI